MVENIGFGRDGEISEALKAFNQSSIADQKRQTLQYTETSDTPKIVQIIMKYSGGRIKDEEQADYLISGLAILMLLFSAYLFFWGGKPEKPDLIDIRKVDQSQFVR